MASNWSKFECEAAVEDYFNMLRLELAGQKYNKTNHRRTLMKCLNNRSDGSVELKHQNISAILIEMGIPYIDGYKPRSNYQRVILPDVVADYLRINPEIQELFEEDSDAIPTIPSVDDWLAAMEGPPPKEVIIDSVRSKTPIVYNPSGVNYLEREAQNQKLGNAREQFIINFERARLKRAGRESLADRIEQVSITQGSSAGFDILSFEKNGTDRFIEAKTTKYGKNTPFFVTRNELKFSQDNAPRYFLYRLFKFRTKPRMFALHGHLQDQCNLEPSLFIARTK